MATIGTVWEPSISQLNPFAQARLAIRANCQAMALNDTPALSAEVIDEIRASGVGIGCLSSPQPISGQSLAGLIDRAVQMWIPNVLVPLAPSEHSYSQAYNELYDLLYAHAPRADQSAVRLLIQAPQEARLLSPLELRSLIDQISSPNVGCCLDFDRCQAHNLSVVHWLQLLSDRVFACRISLANPITAELTAHWARIDSNAFCLTNNLDVIAELDRLT